MNTPDMRWESDNLSVVGDGTLIWLTQKALWFSSQDKSNNEWLNAAVRCSGETMKRFIHSENTDLLIPLVDIHNATKAEQAAKRIRERG